MNIKNRIKIIQSLDKELSNEYNPTIEGLIEDLSASGSADYIQKVIEIVINKQHLFTE